MKIFVDCSKEVTTFLKETLSNYTLNKPQKEMCMNDILIVELSTADKVEEIKTFPCAKICIIHDGEYIFEILELNPIAILRKPYLDKDKKVLLDCLDKQLPQTIAFKTGNNELRLNVSHILYVESFLHDCIIHSDEGQFKIRETLTNMKKSLERYGFRQIHKSYLVNEKYVLTLSYKECELTNHMMLPVGRKYKEN